MDGCTQRRPVMKSPRQLRNWQKNRRRCKAAFHRLLNQTGARAEQVCYVGDDLPDVPVLRNCGFPVTVADACAEGVWVK